MNAILSDHHRQNKATREEFKALYESRNQLGGWQSKRRGLHVGMDLHDFRRFVALAVQIIERDHNLRRRARRLERLYDKALVVVLAEPGWIVPRALAHIRLAWLYTMREISSLAANLDVKGLY